MIIRKTTGFQPEFIRQSQMPRLLNILGVSGSYTNHAATNYVASGGWWERHEAELDYILADIHRSYRKKAKELRIELVQNNEQSVQLNLAWAKVRRLFAARGINLN